MAVAATIAHPGPRRIACRQSHADAHRPVHLEKKHAFIEKFSVSRDFSMNHRNFVISRLAANTAGSDKPVWPNTL
jgi:hypothetical protein